MIIDGTEVELKVTRKVWKKLEEKKHTWESIIDITSDGDKAVEILSIIAGISIEDMEKATEDMTLDELVGGMMDAVVESMPEKVRVMYRAQMDMLENNMADMMSKLTPDQIIAMNEKK